MSESPSSQQIQTAEFLDFITSVMRYRRRIMNSLPEELIRHKERLELAHLNEGSRRFIDNAPLPRVGAILARYGEPLPMGELSKALDVPLSTATRMVDGLVDNGYAERLSDPEDRRIVRVALTETGRGLFQTMYAYIQQCMDEALSPLTPKEREQLSYLLRKVALAMEADGK